MSSTYAISNGEASDAISSKGQYEVFLSFRGPDTRTGFTDHLYTRLKDAGIRVYRDDEELRVGGDIGPELIAAINQSKIAIPIFSKGYAASKWCLRELAHIVECKRTKGLKVMPIFYNVTPFDVRYQTGDFAEAFVSHERLYGDETTSWKEALKMVGALKGWDIQSDRNRQEGKLVKEVVTKVLRELKKAYLTVTDCLVGVDYHVEEILNKVCAEKGGVQILGIYGMGGIGKTTLSKVIYNRLLSQFENFVFLADVRETSQSKGMVFLQNQFISSLLKTEFPSITNNDEGIATISTRFLNIKALIVLDDIDKNFQLQGLVGKRNWFGSGTRIIITTRNKRLLDFIQVDWPFELSCMAPPQALQLFSKHAFRDDKPPQKHVELSRKIVEKTGGLPLALEVVGSLLYGQSTTYWHSVLKKLEHVPQKEVTEKLRISFEALDECQKHIFLDIACFFIGLDHRIMIHYWDDSKLFPEEAIEVLQQLCLIKVKENNLLWMHDQLRDYGRDIVRQEGIWYPEKRSRLWNREEATKVFMTKGEKENIQGIHVKFNEKSHPYFIEEEFAKLSKVRLFWVDRDIDFDYPSNFPPEKPLFPHSESNIFSEVRWLSWPDFPHTYIKSSNFSFLNLTILKLANSFVTSDWDGWNQIKMATNLRVLNLFECSKLVKTPDFSSHLKLERLILQGCSDLVEIDESIGMLKHLVHLNLRGCGSLRKLPKEMCCMESLTELLIDYTGIVEIPSWCSMVKLEAFDSYDCYSLNYVSLNGLTFIKKLSLTNCQITSIPDSIGELVNLLGLDLHGCKLLKKLPEAIAGLVSLIQLNIWDSGIEELPNSIGCLESLELLKMSGTPVRELPATIGMARKLEEIDASFCDDLIGLPMLPESLINLTIPFKIMATIPDLSNLTYLRQLKAAKHKRDLGDPWSGELASTQSPSPWWIGRLSKSEDLELAFPTITTLHPDLGALSQLKKLTLTNCHRLQSIPKLPLNLTTLRVSQCESLERISDLSHLKKLTTLSVKNTPLVGLECPPALDFLFLVDCRDLVEIPGRSEYLRHLSITCCKSLVKIPDVLNLKTLEYLLIVGCPKLCHEVIYHEGPILTDNSLKSEVEQNCISNMLKICGYSPSTSCLGKTKAEGKGKEIEEMG